MNLVAAVKLGINLATAAYQGVQAAKQGMALVERLVAERRDPSEAEWAELNAVSFDLDRQIAAERDRLQQLGSSEG